jgi:hypothetical protein
MPVIEILDGYHMQAMKGTEVKERDGQPTEAVEVWQLVLTNMVSKDQIRISFRREARDELVRQLTGGVVLAGGELPRL